MKKIILLGVIIVGITTINISQLINSPTEKLSFNQLLNTAFADGESGGGECFTVMVDQGGDEYLCPDGIYYEGEYWEEYACSGSGGGSCQSGIMYVKKECDGTQIEVGPDDSNCPQ